MKIIDTTIRDGSYAVDFKFSCKDVKDLVEKSRRIGIEYIEIGHGQGLNASSDEHGFSLQSDEEYMDAAREVAGDCKLGMFCIPGIARIDDVRKAKEHGMDFLRIGVTVQGFNEARPFIDQCKSEGLEVFVNFMKTPTALPKEFGEASANAYKRGARCVYIVDSAGSMSESDIGKYITAAREKSDVELGFHGHNNMGLAVGNTIYCITEGMEFVDCTFQGLGRSLGNAPLEQVVMLLERKGYHTGFDLPRVLEYGYAGLRNIVSDKLVNPLDYMCGYAGFHSSFLKYIYKCSSEKNVDPLRLILAYSEENKLSMDYERLCEVADTLPKDMDDNPYSFGEYFSIRYKELPTSSTENA